MTERVREALLFGYEVYHVDEDEDPCEGCGVYVGHVRVDLAVKKLWLCRQCLERMRVTLKAAWKETMPTTKQVRPK